MYAYTTLHLLLYIYDINYSQTIHTVCRDYQAYAAWIGENVANHNLHSASLVSYQYKNLTLSTFINTVNC